MNKFIQHLSEKQCHERQKTDLSETGCNVDKFMEDKTEKSQRATETTTKRKI
jgi:hypothetical protein